MESTGLQKSETLLFLDEGQKQIPRGVYPEQEQIPHFVRNDNARGSG